MHFLPVALLTFLLCFVTASPTPSPIVLRWPTPGSFAFSHDQIAHLRKTEQDLDKIYEIMEQMVIAAQGGRSPPTVEILQRCFHREITPLYPTLLNEIRRLKGGVVAIGNSPNGGPLAVVTHHGIMVSPAFYQQRTSQSALVLFEPTVRHLLNAVENFRWVRMSHKEKLWPNDQGQLPNDAMLVSRPLVAGSKIHEIQDHVRSPVDMLHNSASWGCFWEDAIKVGGHQQVKPSSSARHTTNHASNTDPLNDLRFSLEIMPGSRKYIFTPAARAEVLTKLYAAMMGSHRELFLSGKGDTIPPGILLSDFQRELGLGKDEESALGEPGKTCHHIFKKGESCYRCKDCSLDDSCVLCARCFHATNHTTHNVSFFIAQQSGGCCDCNDPEAWRVSLNCPYHPPPTSPLPPRIPTSPLPSIPPPIPNSSIPHLPPALITSIRRTIAYILDYTLSVLDYSPDEPVVPTNEADLRLQPSADPMMKDTYCLVLWNDDKHSFEEVRGLVGGVLGAAGVYPSGFGSSYSYSSASSTHADPPTPTPTQLVQTLDAQGRVVLLTSSNIPKLLDIAQSLAQVDLGVTVRRAYDTFQEMVVGVCIEWLSDLTRVGLSVEREDGSKKWDKELVREMMAMEMLNPRRRDSFTTHLSPPCALYITPPSSSQTPSTQTTTITQQPTRLPLLLLSHPRLPRSPRLLLKSIYASLLSLSHTHKLCIATLFSGVYERVVDSYLLSDREAESSVKYFALQVFTVESVGGWVVLGQGAGATAGAPSVGGGRDGGRDGPHSGPNGQLGMIHRLLLIITHFFTNQIVDKRIVYEPGCGLGCGPGVGVGGYSNGPPGIALGSSATSLSSSSASSQSQSQSQAQAQGAITPSNPLGLPPQTLTLLQTRSTTPIDPDSFPFKSKRFMPVFSDLRYLSCVRGVRRGVWGGLVSGNTSTSSPPIFTLFTRTCSLFMCLNPNKRAVDTHVEYETDAWISVFNVTLSLSRVIRVFGEAFGEGEEDGVGDGSRGLLWSQVDGMDDEEKQRERQERREKDKDLRTRALIGAIEIVLHQILLVVTLAATPNRLDPAKFAPPAFHTVRFGSALPSSSSSSQHAHGGPKEYTIVSFDVCSGYISFHHSLHWLLAELMKHTRVMSDERLNKVGYAGGLKEVVGRVVGERGVLGVVDYPLRVLAMIAQIRTGLWVRNGFAIRGQLLHYRDYMLRELCYDQDLFIVQSALILLPPDLVLVSILDRFGLREYFDGDLVGALGRWDGDDRHVGGMVEEVFYVLGVLVNEGGNAGAGVFSLSSSSSSSQAQGGDAGQQPVRAIERAIRREIVHALAPGPCAYSDLVKRVSERLVEDRAFDRVLKVVGSFKMLGDSVPSPSVGVGVAGGAGVGVGGEGGAAGSSEGGAGAGVAESAREGAGDGIGAAGGGTTGGGISSGLGTETGIWELKEACFDEVDPFFYHYTRNRREEVENVLKKRAVSRSRRKLEEEARRRGLTSGGGGGGGEVKINEEDILKEWDVVIEPKTFGVTEGPFTAVGEVWEGEVLSQVLFWAVWNVLSATGLEGTPNLAGGGGSAGSAGTPPPSAEAILDQAVHLAMVGVVERPETFSRKASERRWVVNAPRDGGGGKDGEREDVKSFVEALWILASHEKYAKLYRARVEWVLDRVERCAGVVGAKAEVVRVRGDRSASGAGREGRMKTPGMAKEEERKRAAKRRQEMILEQMKKQQKSFESMFGEDCDSDEEDEDDENGSGDEGDEGGDARMGDVSPSRSSTSSGGSKSRGKEREEKEEVVSFGTCIVCQEDLSTANLASKPFGSLGLVQPSRLIKRHPDGQIAYLNEALGGQLSMDRTGPPAVGTGGGGSSSFPPMNADSIDAKSTSPNFEGFPTNYTRFGLHASVCTHLMHLECFQVYNVSIRQRHRTQATRNHPECIPRKEYICPLCKSLGNVIIPCTPPDKKTALNPVAFADWIRAAGIHILKSKPDPLLESLQFRNGTGEFVFWSAQDGGYASALRKSLEKEKEKEGSGGGRERERLDYMDAGKMLDTVMVVAKSISQQTRHLRDRMEPEATERGAGIYLPDELVGYTIASLEIQARGVAPPQNSGPIPGGTTVMVDGMSESQTMMIRGLLGCLQRLAGLQFRNRPDEGRDAVRQAIIKRLLPEWSRTSLTSFSYPLLLRDPFTILVETAAVAPEMLRHVLVLTFYACLARTVIGLVYILNKTRSHNALPIAHREHQELFGDIRIFFLSVVRHSPVFEHTAMLAFDNFGEARIEKLLYTFSLQFLRRAAILCRAVLPLSFQTPQFNDVTENEYVRLLVMLGIPPLSDLPNHDTLQNALSGWCAHYGHSHASSQINCGVLLDYPVVYKLARLPLVLDRLFNRQDKALMCTNCDTFPVDAAICLICGTTVCMQSGCCVDEDYGNRGECNMHTRECGGTIGIYYCVKRCSILYINSGNGTFAPSPYLDQHGEVDLSMRRGRRQYLHQPRWEVVRKTWLSHGIPSIVARKLESTLDSGGWETL